MVVERVGGVLRNQATVRIVPGLWRVEVRLDDREVEEVVSKIVELAFGQAGHGEMAVSHGARRMTIRIGSYPREIAEARAEAMKARAALGGLNLDVCIRRI